MTSETSEIKINPKNGWIVLTVLILLAPFIVISFINDFDSYWVIGSIFITLIWAILWGGFFTLQPNESRVLILFGKYRGTVSRAGFCWMNPLFSNGTPKGDHHVPLLDNKKDRPKFDSRFKISLRSRTFLSQQIKVNDKHGNPIEIAMLVVWKVSDTAKALFAVDDYRNYVETQAESALRHVATQFSYDHRAVDQADEEITLRGNPGEVSEVLRQEMTEVLKKAGITVEDTRLTHLAYAPEIAQIMLKRQQAEAIISARMKIVSGAVSMVDLALRELEKSGNVTLNEEKKAAMIANMMLVLVGDRDVAPIINTSSL